MLTNVLFKQTAKYDMMKVKVKKVWNTILINFIKMAIIRNLKKFKNVKNFEKTLNKSIELFLINSIRIINYYTNEKDST